MFLLPRFWDVGGNETNPGITRSVGRAGELICLVSTVTPPPPCKFNNLDYHLAVAEELTSQFSRSRW